MRNYIGPWEVGSELVVENDVYFVMEYERAKDGHWVVLRQLGQEVPDFWLVKPLLAVWKAAQ